MFRIMRRRLILTVMVSAAAVLAMTIAVSIALRPNPSPPDPAAGNASASVPATRDNPAAPAAGVSPGFAIQPALATNDIDHVRFVRQRVAELNALAMKSDTTSRDIILSELQNPDKAIREGALEATIQFGDRSVLPRLQEVADQTEDADEKKALLDAIDYLKLPSLTEYLASHPAERSSLGLTNIGAPVTNRMGRHPRPQ